MSKLLKSNFVRLRKNPIFWLVLVSATVNPLYCVLNNYYYGKQFGHDYAPDDALMMIANGYIFPLALSVLIGSFIGTEYQDKTMRNKLICGHTRTSLYLSYLITCVTVALTMYAVGVITAVAAGIPLLGSYESTAKILLPQMGCTLLSVTALASIFTFLSTLISNRVIGGIVTLLISAGLAYIPASLWNDLYSSFDDLTATGFWHTLYSFLYDFLPTSQLYQYTAYAENIPKALGLFPIYSILIIAVTNVIGVLCFQKKNLK